MTSDKCFEISDNYQEISVDGEEDEPKNGNHILQFTATISGKYLRFFTGVFIYVFLFV